jgi:hypothetical protein
MSDDRDGRDPALDALLRAHSAATPPPHLDTAILAAAHRAVDSAPRDAARALARQSWRWWMPLAAAAAIGVIVIGVLPLAPVTPGETSPAVSDVPASSRPIEKDAVDDAAERRGKAKANVEVTAPPPVARKEAAGTAVRQASEAAAPAATVPKVATAPPATAVPAAPGQAAVPKSTTVAPRARDPSIAAGVPATTTAAPGTGDSPAAPLDRMPMSQPAQPQALAPSPSREAGALAASPTEAARPPALAKREAVGRTDSSVSDAAQWIARIRALRIEGNFDAARDELIRFRKAVPDADARLPDDLREWASSVR